MDSNSLFQIANSKEAMTNFGLLAECPHSSKKFRGSWMTVSGTVMLNLSRLHNTQSSLR